MAAPPPDLTISQWADRYRILSPEFNAEPGQWNTSRAEYQREPMDAISDPLVPCVVLKWASQTGKTDATILNTVGYHIHLDPGPMLVMQPNQKPMGEAFSKERLAPMLRDTTCLHGKVSESKSRDSNNTILMKRFKGGYLAVIGANSPAGLASRPIRILLADEIDRYPPSAGTEGDPLSLARQRLTTFWNRKEVITSTPTIKGLSRIDTEYDDSTMETWQLQCPECGEYQQILWHHFDREALTAVCAHCGAASGEREWKRGPGRWVAKQEHPTTRGFHLNAFVSPWKTWRKISDRYAKAEKEGPEGMKTFWNLEMGESWEEEGETHEPDSLLDRREMYAAPVPMGGLILTMGVDIQKDRLECELVAWGKDDESWNIDYRVIRGDPKRSEVWEQLNEYRRRKWLHESGVELSVYAVGVDTGYLAREVYNYCKGKSVERVFATKGAPGQRAIVESPMRKRTGRRGRPVELYILGVDVAKSIIYERLGLSVPGPGYCHFPADRDEEYFRMLTAETLITGKNAKGFPTHEWRLKRPRNEALDCRVIAFAMLKMSDPKWDYLHKKIETAAEKLRVEKGETAQAETEKKTTETRHKRRRSGGGFASRW